MAKLTRLSTEQICNTIDLTLKMISAQVVETSITNTSSFQNYPHPDDHTIRTSVLTGTKAATLRYISGERVSLL